MRKHNRSAKRDKVTDDALSTNTETHAGDKGAKSREVVGSTSSDTEYTCDEEGNVEGWLASD